MNTIQIDTVAGDVSDIHVNQRVMLPLSALLAKASTHNVRLTARLMSIPELADNIASVGLLQNLVVFRAEQSGKYEVAAGGRRLAALKLLAKQKRLPVGFKVPCLLIAKADAREASLTENVLRLNMHPADEFDGFAALQAQGTAIEDIAATFGVTPLVVQRRLRLANVSPRLLAAYRADEVALDQLMALAVTDDHAAQEAAFYDAPQWQRSASTLRHTLISRKVPTSDAIVRFVGIDAYQAAGGVVFQDLFSDEGAGGFVEDTALLDRLARSALEVAAENVRSEGWGWVDVAPHCTYSDRAGMSAAPWQIRERTDDEGAREDHAISSVETIQADIDAGTCPDEDAAYDEIEALQAAICELRGQRRDYAPHVKAFAGAIVSIDSDATLIVHRGLVRAEDQKAQRLQERRVAGDVSEDGRAETDVKAFCGMSDRLAERLSAHRTVALQMEVAAQPGVALALLVDTLADRVLGDGLSWHSPCKVQATLPSNLEAIAPDLAAFPAAAQMEEARDSWRVRLAGMGDDRFAALLTLPENTLLELAALCIASTVDVSGKGQGSGSATLLRGAALADAVGLKADKWWQPTADSYFRHLTKAQILAAVGEFDAPALARLQGLKKDALALEAGGLVEGTGWMPGYFGGALVGGDLVQLPDEMGRVLEDEQQTID